jgi:hypothetical protein
MHGTSLAHVKTLRILPNFQSTWTCLIKTDKMVVKCVLCKIQNLYMHPQEDTIACLTDAQMQ